MAGFQTRFGTKAADLQGNSINIEDGFDPEFARQTNVAERPKRVAGFKALILGRTPLTRHAGVVRSRQDGNTAVRNTLKTQWLPHEAINAGWVSTIYGGVDADGPWG